MTVTEALEKLKSYEQTSFALSHAMGLLYYDGVTAAPKGAAAVRSDTTGELSRIDYQLTTAPDTVEMLETLMAARTELDDVTRRKVEEYWRSYDRTRRIPEEEFVAYQKLTTRADDVWQTAPRRFPHPHPAGVLRLRHGRHGHRPEPLHHRRDGASLHHQLLP